MSLIKNNGKVINFYHGTNRTFTKHSSDKNRTILNDKFQGDWICYTADKDVAWKYANAARNQCLDKEIFLRETDQFISRCKDKHGVSQYFKQIVEGMIEIGHSEGWDITFEQYRQDNNLPEDWKQYIFMEKLTEFSEDNNFDLNEFCCDVLEYVEGSKMAEPSQNGAEMLMNMFNHQIDELPGWINTFLEKLGYEESIVKPQVLVSCIKAKKILETSDSEEAKAAKEQGYDLVIYSGEGTVDGEPEYLVSSPEQVLMHTRIVENRIPFTTDDGWDGYSSEYQEIDLRKPKVKEYAEEMSL